MTAQDANAHSPLASSGTDLSLGFLLYETLAPDLVGQLRRLTELNDKCFAGCQAGKKHSVSVNPEDSDIKMACTPRVSGGE